MLELSYFQPEQYPTLVEWWTRCNHVIIPITSLAHGIVVSKNKELLCISFVYIWDGCDLAQMGWTTVNPDIDKETRNAAIELVLDGSILFIESTMHHLVMGRL